MTDNYTPPRIDKKYISLFAIAVFLTWTLHELAHWAVGEYLGYKMRITLNSGYPLSGQYSKDLHYQIISAAGSIFTLSEAVLIFILMMQKGEYYFILSFLLAFTCDFLQQ